MRANISIFHRLPAVDVERAVTQLRDDLDTGAWTQRNRGILARSTLDVGLRVVVADVS